MSDYGAEYTEEHIKELEKEMQKVYSQTNKEITEKIKQFTNKYKSKDKEYQKRVKNGEMTKKDYDAWKRNQVFKSNEWQDKKKQIQKKLSNSNENALDIINSHSKDVFATNVNYAEYQVEMGIGMNLNFNIYDETTVNRLIKEQPELLPVKYLDRRKDLKWNTKKINNQVTQSIIQGESIDDLAKRISTITGVNASNMMTNARTMMTSAQNGGRLAGYREAEKLGLKLYKQWISAHDGHTRISHLYLDGQEVGINEPFEYGAEELMYPGDPDGSPAMVYNCRCTMVADTSDGFESEDYAEMYEEYDNEYLDISFEEWLEGHE